MKVWLAVFAAAALLAAFLGFTGKAEGAAAIATVLAIGFVVLAFIALLAQPRERRET